MGRKNNIEGQLDFFDMLLSETTAIDEQEKSSGKKTAGQITSYQAGGFPECSSCWCKTCEHSTVGGSKPRPFGDSMRACPSCELCINEGIADVCVIGSAEEGCKFRAEKEGV